ncbi:MAG: CoA ester lyase, partial [Burkholderiales bacterium PBB4]
MNRPARSLLFVPGDRPERFAKAHASGADAVILDLEDAVAPAAKAAAREACRQYLAGGGAALLRINALDSGWANDDLELCRLPGVQGVVLPKADSATAVLAAAQRSGKPVLPLIESAPGLINLREIAAARGVSRLLFGSVDLCLDLGIEGDENELASH